ncbi:DUF4136 domain-containing protein [Ramlibacter sp. MAHUQ-53]|uniref:DUF4136 domain-containing protein n=1 Tax=unclassified Ramlibacter TaxID=2617605 RepID=UPI003644115B
MKHPVPRSLLLALLAAAALLAGCASTYRLENTVQSYSTLAGVPAPATYRYERLPSQAADPSQTRLELAADGALARAGLRRDDAAGRYAVQVSSRVQQVMSPYAGPRWSGWGSWGTWNGRRGLGVGMAYPFWGWDTGPTWYQREVGLVMRDATTGRVVYETHAYNDGTWVPPETALSALLDAALQGFPVPPAGPRRVDIEIKR